MEKSTSPSSSSSSSSPTSRDNSANASIWFACHHHSMRCTQRDDGSLHQKGHFLRSTQDKKQNPKPHEKTQTHSAQPAPSTTAFQQNPRRPTAASPTIYCLRRHRRATEQRLQTGRQGGGGGRGGSWYALIHGIT